MDEEIRLRVNENGRVVIPSSFRKALGINIGDEVMLRVQDDELRITTMKRRIERAQCRARKYLRSGESLVDQLLAERRQEARKESGNKDEQGSARRIGHSGNHRR